MGFALLCSSSFMRGYVFDICGQNQPFLLTSTGRRRIKTNHSLNWLIVGGKVSAYRHPGKDASQVVRISQELWDRS